MPRSRADSSPGFRALTRRATIATINVTATTAISLNRLLLPANIYGASVTHGAASGASEGWLCQPGASGGRGGEGWPPPRGGGGGRGGHRASEGPPISLQGHFAEEAQLVEGATGAQH